MCFYQSVDRLDCCLGGCSPVHVCATKVQVNPRAACCLLLHVHVCTTKVQVNPRAVAVLLHQSAGEPTCNVLSLPLHACTRMRNQSAGESRCNVLSLVLHACSDVHVCTAKVQVNPRALDIADKGFAVTGIFPDKISMCTRNKISSRSEPRSCVKVEVAVLGSRP